MRRICAIVAALGCSALCADKPFGIWVNATKTPAAVKKAAPFVNGAFDWKLFDSTLGAYASAGVPLVRTSQAASLSTAHIRCVCA
jgi:hypothetical protein